MRYSDAHETSYLRTRTFQEGARGSGSGSALLRCFRLAPLPNPSSQLKGRAPASDSRKPRLRTADRAQCAIHEFNGRGLGALRAGSSRPREVHAAFDEDGAQALRELLHHSPREFGKQRSLWTLEDAAQVSFEEELTERRVSGETIRATLARLGVRWERAKRWIESPDPEYERKKGLSSG
jgi:hypothetical protein